MKKNSIKKLVSLLLISSLLLGISTLFGCNKKSTKKNDIEIVTSFYPVYIFTKNLVQDIDNVQVINITENLTGCMHEYQLLPKDMVTLNNASLLVISGSGMETFVNKVSKQLPDLPICESSKGVKLLETKASLAGHTSEKEYNAHVWLSVSNAIIQVKNISKELIKIMPDKKEIIEKNKKEYIKRLNTLDSQIKTELKPYQDTPIMTFHEAYTYFTDDYGLNVVDVIESEHNEEPSAKEVARLTDVIKNKHVKGLFIEPDYKGTSVGVLSSETGVKYYKINPITSGDKSLNSYEEIMLNNVNVIKEALG